MSVSVLLLAHNEAQNLPRCLKALDWCADVVIVDDQSTDETPQIGRDYGARVFERRLDTFAGQRNWALDNVEWRNEWILHLDADEVVTPELTNEIRRAISSDVYGAYRIPSKLIFMGKWLRHAAAYPVYQVRLGRNPDLRYRQVGHGQQEDLSPDCIGTITEPYLHFSFSKGLDDWFHKHARYAAQEADRILGGKPEDGLNARELFSTDRVRRRRAMKKFSARLPARSTARFLYGYLLKGGFLDGRAGLLYCRLMAIYEGMITVQIAEKKIAKKSMAFD